MVRLHQNVDSVLCSDASNGDIRVCFGLIARGSLLLLITLGIYRFWLATDVRRFLWGNTELAGDALDYTGTPVELLIGFLMALALLLPINGLIFAGTLMPDALPFSSLLGFALFALLGQFALYRARRYRLTRTVFRGVRLYQTGAGWRYAVRAVLWWILNAMTLGLSYPWAQANLERYKLRHTHYGDLTGQFVGTGTQLFLRGILLWVAVIGPVVYGLFAGLTRVDWGALGRALTGSGSLTWERIEAASPELGVAVVVAMSAFGFSIVAAALLYPAFRAIMLRWWLSGLRLGGVSATSNLRVGQIYRVYLRFLGYASLVGIVVAVASIPVFWIGQALLLAPGHGTAAEIAAAVLGVGAYVLIMLAYSAVYQATVTIRFWRLSFETITLTGLEALDGVEARGTPSTAFGEGLAGTLDLGGL